MDASNSGQSERQREVSWSVRTSHLAGRLLLPVAAALFLSACSSEGQDAGGEGVNRAVYVRLDGRIIGGSAQSIRSFDLSDGSNVEVARWPSLIVNDLSRIDANRLLVSVDIRSPSQHGDRSWDWVAIYDMRSNELRYQCLGQRDGPCYALGWNQNHRRLRLLHF